LLGTAAVVHVFRPSRLLILIVAFGLFAFAAGQEARSAVARPKIDLEQRVERSPRLTWIAANTSQADVIIGDDVTDVPFLLHSSAATLSFSPYPYTQHATYQKIRAYAQRHCGEFRSILLVLRRNQATEEQ